LTVAETLAVALGRNPWCDAKGVHGGAAGRAGTTGADRCRSGTALPEQRPAAVSWSGINPAHGQEPLRRWAEGPVAHRRPSFQCRSAWWDVVSKEGRRYRSNVRATLTDRAHQPAGEGRTQSVQRYWLPADRLVLLAPVSGGGQGSATVSRL